MYRHSSAFAKPPFRWRAGGDFPLRFPRYQLNARIAETSLVAGINWVTQNAVRPAVANISLGGSVSITLDDAVRSSIAAGITYVVAAGDGTSDACNVSPARVTEAITVAATGKSDVRSSFSNYGGCVDIFAPGENITSAWISDTNTTSTATLSGTSTASPHVAGVVALYLEANREASPHEVTSALLNGATPHVVTDADSPSSLLLFSGFVISQDIPPFASFRFNCAGLTCTFDGTASMDDVSIESYAWKFGDGTLGTGAAPSHTYRSGGTFVVTLTVRDSGQQTSSVSKSVTVTGPCDACPSYTGTLAEGESAYEPIASFPAKAGTHKGWLTGPAAANFDLYLRKWNGKNWVRVARSTGETSTEAIVYVGRAGFYSWRIYARTGSGKYTFTQQKPE